MIDRVKAAEFSMEKIIRSIEKKKEIKEYTKSVSKLKGYKRFLHATDVKNKFDQLRNDFDRCMADLNFTVVDSSAIERKDESERIDKALKEVEESFKEVGDKLDDGFKQVGDKFDAAVVQHIDFMQMTNSKFHKPIDGQNESELALLGKLGLSPQIIKFYGHSLINNSKVMIFERAERGNLRELYKKHDILWTKKIQVARDIQSTLSIPNPWVWQKKKFTTVLLNLLFFLCTVNVFHVRCENVFVLRDLSVKLGNFACVNHVDELATYRYIVHWDGS
ncbi:kinase-like protein [Gigaspora margarita]|uniref:Kinase-like protein n=1 Tax=Gigaspora margarita TaxID=4874 RepID=A0A8H3ZWK8_GIGMA|nr:kinase-like protein [Gigaspora margarita]